MSIEIEFPLEPARRAMKPSQIQLRLFQDSGCQIFSARLVLVVSGSVHAVLIWFVTYFLSVSKIHISARVLGASICLHTIFLKHSKTRDFTINRIASAVFSSAEHHRLAREWPWLSSKTLLPGVSNRRRVCRQGRKESAFAERLANRYGLCPTPEWQRRTN
jgi:hypothetical protein